MPANFEVSVIVPVYNVEKYLHKCLQSLVEQTLERIEIIVVNDGSKDSSQKIIDDFRSNFPDKVFTFQKENGGLSDARNFGIDRARGRYLGFVDSDDYITPSMFEDLYRLAEKHHAEIAICNLQKINEYGEVTQKLTQLPGFPERIVLKDNLFVFSDLSYFACNKLFKREIFAVKRFKKGVHFEDIELIPRLLLDCQTIAFSPAYHYQYFERQDSISKSHTTKGLDILAAVETVEKYYRNGPYADKQKPLRNFWILEGVYSFLAYLAFVKKDEDFYQMSSVLDKFINTRNVGIKEILQYRRFGKNYLLSLPLRKKLYYILYFFGFRKLLRCLMRN